MEARVRKNVTSTKRETQTSVKRELLRVRINGSTGVPYRLVIDSSVDTTTIATTAVLATFASDWHSWATYDLSFYAF
ncbi:hypothetical protein SOVF_162230 [Spinacia oleracea]|nr:hypothetical protein SOVF_162230 [Spinacia oleracea]